MGIVASDFHGTYDTYKDIMPEVDIIITGTNWDTAVEDVFSKEELHIPIFFNDLPPGTKPDLKDVINNKAEIINSIGITKFYEDQEEQISLLKVLCPGCKFIKV